MIIINLAISLALTTFKGMSSKNSTMFTRPSLTGRRTHETKNDIQEGEEAEGGRRGRGDLYTDVYR